MTDNEIIKGLERCINKDLVVFYHIEKNATVAGDWLESKTPITIRDVTRVITNLQAEIEALQMDNKQLQSDVIVAKQNYDHIKELWEKEKAGREKLRNTYTDLVKRYQMLKAENERLQGCIKSEDEVREIMESQMGDVIGKAMEEVIKEKFEETIKLGRTESALELFHWLIDLFPEDKNVTTISKFTVKQKYKEMMGETK